MFERFSPEARRAVTAAREAATRHGDQVVSSAHLLVGLFTGDEVVGRLLARFGVTLESLWETLPALPPTAPHGSTFSKECVRTLESSLREALAAGHPNVTGLHMLAGALRDPESLASVSLALSGVDIPALRGALTDALGVPEFASAAPTGASRRPDGLKVLSEFGRDLVAAAADGELDRVVGRERELERLLQVLSRRTKANPVLVGPPGVGKTAVVEALAQLIADKNAPEHLSNSRVWSVDVGSLVSGTRLRGDMEARVKGLLEEASDPDIILFIDEIHVLLGAGGAEGALNMSQLLKPALARGEIRLIGATTLDEYRVVEKDAAFERRLQPVRVDEPDVETAVVICDAVRSALETHHQVTFSSSAVRSAVELAVRYVNDRHLPDSAIDLLDEAGARLAVAHADDRQVTSAVIASVCEAMTGVPVPDPDADHAVRALGLHAELSARVVGQTQAVSVVAASLRRAAAGLRDMKRPVGSFLFVGPTGVGKTETAKALARSMYGTEDALVTIDMSEYMEKHTVARLIGAPPGYVGHDQPGQLTEAVRRKPWSVVLLDEIDKAHPDVFDVLLQLLEEGRLTDASGRVVSFANCVVIATSNVGADVAARPTLGFRDSRQARSSEFMSAVTRLFRPELLNRFDEVVVFEQLTLPDVRRIADVLLAELADRVADRGCTMVVTDAACDELARLGYDPAYGARPLRRVVQTHVSDRLGELLLSGAVTPGSKVCVDVVDGQVTVTVAHVEVPQTALC